MRDQFLITLVDERAFSVDELAMTVDVTREWVIEHVLAGVLIQDAPPEPQNWKFGARELLRSRRVRAVEQAFEANAELAGLVVDLSDEIARLRRLVRRAGLSGQ